MSRKAFISTSQDILNSTKMIYPLYSNCNHTENSIFSAFPLLLSHSKQESYAIICSTCGNDKMKLLHSALSPSPGSLPVTPRGDCMVQIQALHIHMHRLSKQSVKSIIDGTHIFISFN